MKNQVPKPLLDYPKLGDWLKVTPEKKLVFFSGRVELGQGNVTALIMMISDELGIEPEKISLQTARTDMTPNEGFTAGSMSIVHGGQSLRSAVATLRQQILNISASRLGVDAIELDLSNGQILHKGSFCFSIDEVLDQIDLSSEIPAGAKIKLGVGGYMEQWVGYVSQDDVGDSDYSGIDVKSDGEVHFKGSTKLDNGMTVGVNVQLEANSGGDMIDESYLILKGGFGEINIGSENSAQYKMQYGPVAYGIGFNSGDQSAWVNTGGTISQSGHYRAPLGSTNVEANGVNDSERLTYYTPRVNGFQLGVTYMPSSSEDSNATPDRNAVKSDYVSVGAIFKQKLGGLSVKVSAGYGTVSDAESGAGSDSEPQATNLGLRLGMGAFGINIATANFEDTLAPAEKNAIFT